MRGCTPEADVQEFAVSRRNQAGDDASDFLAPVGASGQDKRRALLIMPAGTLGIEVLSGPRVHSVIVQVKAETGRKVQVGFEGDGLLLLVQPR